MGLGDDIMFLGEAEDIYKKTGKKIKPLCRLSDRIAYQLLASEGKSIFDVNHKPIYNLKNEWVPLLHFLKVKWLKKFGICNVKFTFLIQIKDYLSEVKFTFLMQIKDYLSE